VFLKIQTFEAPLEQTRMVYPNFFITRSASPGPTLVFWKWRSMESNSGRIFALNRTEVLRRDRFLFQFSRKLAPLWSA
jgi:hypothetical protein